MINFKHLRCFLAAAEEGTLARAGAKIHLAPQTVGGQIKELEGRLGLALFKLEGRRLELTEAGRALLDPARKAFAAGALVEESAARWRKGRVLEQFKAGFCPEFPIGAAAAALAGAMEAGALALSRRAPGMELVQSVARSELDVAVVLGEPDSRVGFREKLGSCALAFAGMQKAAEDWCSKFPECLSGAPAILPSKGTPLRALVDAWAAEAKVELLCVAESESSSMCLELAEMGLGWAAVPLAALPPAALSGGLSIIGYSEDFHCEFFALWAGQSRSSPQSLAFLDSAMMELARDGHWNKPGEAAS